MTARATSQTRTRRVLRQFNRQVKAGLYLSSYASTEDLARDIQRRVRTRLYSRSAGTLVAIGPDGSVYLLMARELRTEKFCGEHFDWVVGMYAELPAGSRVPEVPTLEVLIEDLEHHLQTHGQRVGLR